ncbi:RNA polymerase sigma factor [Metabacillus fastidiosus]|uniref:RNA polymerase sigma factor n=1 Tax=Metabacillus fastidiosus TaxID=1458 RepID=A0ABU6NXV3_9BACI|nr:RNA polymerase sigma factor [Metabacillus fastidiosus]MED4401954.1 RNA polymerase sigma factor [Metabacillus fastidiosus]MED4454671.1 RNA polymerase sigma factor [Metabacillus fastidiosus]MED4460913.1 RNA polymerase sigma factor [Metabacillus fastidiosus]
MFRNKAKEIFSEFVIEHKENVYRLAYSYVKNEQDALDIVQDSIVKGLKSLHSLKDDKVVKSWFYRIVVNTALDFLRKHKRVQIVDDIEIHASIEETKYHDIDLERALEILPLPYYEIITLRFFEDLKLEDIAFILKLPVNTVKTRLYRALKLLRMNME